MGSSGIRLAVCKQIVEGYGRRILVESEWGEGSVFFSLYQHEKLIY